MKTTQKLAMGIGLVVAALASPAWASEKDYDLQLAAGGGVSGFIEGAADQTKVGGSWDVPLRLRTALPIGAEIGYVGTANGVSDQMSVNAPNGIILSNGFEANAVLSLLPRRSVVDPYVFVGGGYTRFNLVHETSYNPSVLRKHDDAFVLPSGAGVSVTLPANLLADARFTYRAIFDDGMIHLSGPGQDALNMSQWGLSARLAYQF